MTTRSETPAWRSRSAVVVVAALEAVAVAVWLIPATVQIVRWPISGPVRVALFAPQYRLVALATGALLAAALLVVWAARSNTLDGLGRVLAPLGLLWIWTVPYLPWVPDRLPLLLVFAGPIRWAVALGAVLWAIGASLGARPALSLRMPGRGAAFAFALAIYLLFGSLAARAHGPWGDQPHYLMIAQSLLTDGDLKIENNHLAGEYRSFYGIELRPHYMMRGQDGEIYSIHAPGLPAILLPLYAVAGYPGAVALMCLIAALAALAVFDLADGLAGRRPAWVAWVAVCLTVPFVPHSWLLFPEIPGALLVAWGALWLWRPVDERRSTWLLRGAAIGFLPWLHTKFIVFLVVFSFGFLLRLWRRPRVAASFFAPIAVAAAAWLYSFYLIYGVFDPQAPYGDYARLFVLTQNIPRGLLGLLFDQKFGLLFYSPIYLTAIAGCWMMLRRPDSRFLGAMLLLTTAAFVGSTTRLYMWWGGSSAPARFLVPILPCLAPMIAVAVERARGTVARALLGVGLFMSLAIALAGILWPERSILLSDPHGRARVVEMIQAGSPLAASLATFTNEDWVTPFWMLVPWLGAAGAAMAAMGATVRWRRQQTSFQAALIGCAVFIVAASALTSMPAAAVRDETAERGVLSLMASYDGERHRPFDYEGRQKATPEQFLRLSVVSTARVPAGPIALPPGAYEARVWFGGGLNRTGDIVVSSSPNAVFGRATGSLSNPAVIPFELPVPVGAVSVNVPDPTLAAGVVRIEIVARSILAASLREDIRVRAVESIRDWPGGYIVYTGEPAYPEGGVFWTRGTEAAAILVAPSGASRIVLTLHLGPLEGDVRISVAGKEHLARVAANALTVFETEVPRSLRLVPVTIQSPGMFRPSEMDPSSQDMRRLGCQVRVELR